MSDLDLIYYRDGPSFRGQLLTSVTDYPARFSFESPIDEVLEGSLSMKTNQSGTFNESDTIEPCVNITIDVGLVTPDNINLTCDTILSVANQVYGLKISRALLDDASYYTFISTVLLGGKLKYLVDLDLSYVNITYECLYSLCKFVNPIISGYNPMKRLTMTKCGLQVVPLV